VDWRPLEPVVTTVAYSGLLAKAPHPHAALLFIDYIHSKEGQQLMMKGGLWSPREDIGSLTQKFKKSYIDEKYGVEMIGATREVIHKAEDRKLFGKAMDSIGLKMPCSRLAYNLDDAFAALDLDAQHVEANDARYNLHTGDGSFTITNNMKEAFEGADFVYPKAWSPKGFFPPYNSKVDKEGAKAYQDKFKDWITTMELLDLTNKAYYMHCGPADRGQEVTDEVLDKYERSLYFEQAENRLHVQKAVMAMIL